MVAPIGPAGKPLQLGCRYGGCTHQLVQSAAELMLQSKAEDESLRFAVFHTADMLIKLEKEYDARWHGEVRG